MKPKKSKLSMDGVIIIIGITSLLCLPLGQHLDSNFNNLLISFDASFFIWVLAVKIPESRRRMLLRNNMAHQYLHFKQSVIYSLLQCAGVNGFQLKEELCDYQKFKAFFSANHDEHWYAALNGLQESKSLMNDILFEMEHLATEVSYVLNNVPINDEKTHSAFKFLETRIHQLNNCSVYQCDPVKYIGEFLWCILARWSIIHGQKQDDWIEEMIESI